MVGKSINFEFEKSNDDEVLVNVNAKDVQVFNCGSKGEKIYLTFNDEKISHRDTMHLNSYHIGNGWAKYHTGLYFNIDNKESYKLIKW